MALDSRLKRASALQHGLPFKPLPAPDSTVADVDRKFLGYIYAAVLVLSSTGVGDIDTHHTTTTGVGAVIVSGIGDVDTQHVSVTGTGTVVGVITGIGDVDTHHVSVAGVGTAPGTQVGDGDGTSGGNYGRVMPYIPARKKKTPAESVQPEPVTEEEVEELLKPKGFEEILRSLRGEADPLSEPPTPAESFFLRLGFSPDGTLVPQPEKEAPSPDSAAVLEKLQELENRIFLEFEQIQVALSSQEENLVARDQAMLDYLIERMEREKLIAALEAAQAADATEKQRLMALLAALAAS